MHAVDRCGLPCPSQAFSDMFGAFEGLVLIYWVNLVSGFPHKNIAYEPIKPYFQLLWGQLVRNTLF